MQTAPAAVPVPARLQARPRWRGLPVPYVAFIGTDGEPDFRVTDDKTRRQVIEFRQCQLCGDKLGGAIFFVGGPASAEALAYFEPAVHLDCLLYAMQVCPFIAGRMEHAPVAKVQADHPDAQVHTDDSYIATKADTFVIIKARSYSVKFTAGRTLLVRPEGVITKTAPLHADAMDAAEWEEVGRMLRLA